MSTDTLERLQRRRPHHLYTHERLYLLLKQIGLPHTNTKITVLSWSITCSRQGGSSSRPDLSLQTFIIVSDDMTPSHRCLEQADSYEELKQCEI